MIVQIRIVIDVPENSKEKYPVAIERIIEAVTEQFPEFKIARPYSPVTVTITDLKDADETPAVL